MRYKCAETYNKNSNVFSICLITEITIFTDLHIFAAMSITTNCQRILDKISTNPLLSDTEKCQICGDSAAIHIHYGAKTCFSCRSFFRRSIQMGIAEKYTCRGPSCRKKNTCEITMKTRKNCKKCRFDKCSNVGMKSSWVLTEDERFKR